MRFAKTTTSIFPFVCGFFPGNRCRFPTLLQGRGPRPFVVAFAMLALALASAPSFGAGACCLPIGSCVQTNQSNCNDLGGSFQGNGTSCDPDPCPTPTGACCFVDAPCQDMTLGDCFAAGVEGAYQGNGTSCAVEGCPPAGACCSSNGSGNCTMTVGSLPCSGIFQGSDTTCEPNPCPQPSAPCCFADQSCEDDMTDENCAAADGYYIGSNTVCADITCPIGACCMPDGSCIPDVFPPACWDSGGTYKGHFSTCSPGFCEIGACCAVYDGGNSEDPFIEGECTRWSNPICAATGGAFQGHGTTCAPNPCPQPTGACCLPDDLCAGVQEQSDCTSAGGTYLGHGSDCSEPFCDASSAVWGSFDSTRSAHPLSSSASGQLRGLIAASGASLASPTSELTFEYLFGVDVFYTSSLREPGELTTEEQIALHDWVASGGTLIVTADYPQEYFPAIESFTDFYGVSSFVELPCVHRVGTPVATHPITEGVEHYRVACSATYSFGADALELGVNGLGDVFMIVIEEATGFPVDGRLLVTGDHNLFEDQYLVEFDNLRLATNMVAWANRHCPIGFAEAPSMVLFREAIDSAWDFGPSDIPGWDHVGFYTDFKVYESHPGYDTGGDDCLTNFVSSYWDPCVNEYRCIDFHSGIQKPHTLASFRHDTIETTTKAANDSVVVLDAALAAAMQEFIEFEMSNPDIQFLDLSCPFFDLACWVDRLQPLLQKGYIEINGGIYYTCVGLVERAAEEAGLNVDEGFIPDEIESFVVPLLADPVPMLSPFLMYNAMTGEFGFNDATDWLLGYLDPVDFLITDPLGRRLGYTAATGELNEIPNAIFSGDGDLEQIVILDPLPGEYVVELVGLGEQAEAAFGGTIEGQLFQGFLEVGQTVELTFVFPEHLCPADLDGDGEVRVPDLIVLLGAWGPNPGHPADLDGNGEVRVPDLITLLGEWGACP